MDAFLFLCRLVSRIYPEESERQGGQTLSGHAGPKCTAFEIISVKEQVVFVCRQGIFPSSYVHLKNAHIKNKG